MDLQTIFAEIEKEHARYGTAAARPKLARTPEEEAKIKAVGSAVCQTYISTALIAMMASRTPATQERWQKEMTRGQAIQSLFTDPAKWEIISGLIWPQ